MTNRIRRISFFGAPSAGKSTTAAHVFSVLKEKGYHAELVPEWVKKLAHQKIQLTKWHQLLIFAEQLMSEHILQERDDDLIIVSDSPVFLGWMYAQHNGVEYAQELKNIWRMYRDSAPPEIVIRLNPEGRHYNPKGRWQTKEEALQLDGKLMQMIQAEGIPYTEFLASEKDAIAEFVLGQVGPAPDFVQK